MLVLRKAPRHSNSAMLLGRTETATQGHPKYSHQSTGLTFSVCKWAAASPPRNPPLMCYERVSGITRPLGHSHYPIDWHRSLTYANEPPRHPVMLYKHEGARQWSTAHARPLLMVVTIKVTPSCVAYIVIALGQQNQHNLLIEQNELLSN